MRYGYWMPVFGGCLRNVEDEGKAATWEYAKRLVVRASGGLYGRNELASVIESIVGVNEGD